MTLSEHSDENTTDKPTKPSNKNEVMVNHENHEDEQTDKMSDVQKNETIANKKGSTLHSIRLKAKQEDQDLFKRLTFILCLLTVSTLITLYFISPFSKVDKVILAGATHSEPEKIAASSGIEVGKSLWPQFFNKNKMIQSIKKENKRIEDAKINLVKGNQFRITVKEYPTIGYVKDKKKTHEVLSNGVILSKENVAKPGNELPILINFKEGDNLDEFLKAYTKFSDETKKNIETIESVSTKTNPFRIKFKMRDGNEVIALSTTVADKMVFYNKIVTEMKQQGVIDMEAGASGVFSYPFETEESSEMMEENGSESQMVAE